MLVCGLAIEASAAFVEDFISRFTAHGQVMVEGIGPVAGAPASLSCGARGESNTEGKFAVNGAFRPPGGGDCTLALSLHGCEARVIESTREAGSAGVGVVVLKPIPGKAGAGLVSFTSLKPPEAARKLREEARKSAAKNNLRDAAWRLEKAVKPAEGDVEARAEPGVVRKQPGGEAGARAALEKVRRLDGRFVLPRVEMAAPALRRQDRAGAVANAAEAARVNPVDHPEVWLHLATARLKNGDAQGAEHDARKALRAESKKKIPKAHNTPGGALVQLGRTGEGVEEIRRYLQEAPGAADAAAVRAQLEQREMR
jgi:Flp pilus assembly protein TadD